MGKHEQKKTAASETRRPRRGGTVQVEPERYTRRQGSLSQRERAQDWEETRARRGRTRDWEEVRGGYEDAAYGGRASAKRVVIILAVVLALLLAVLVAVAVWGVRVTRMDEIYPNVSMDGVAVGGMTRTEAAAALEAAGDNLPEDASVTVKFPTGDTLTVTAADVGLGDNDGTLPAEAAWNYGRDGGVFKNLKTYLSCKKTPVALTYDREDTLDAQALTELVTAAALQVNEKLTESQTTVEETQIIIVKGMSGAQVDVEEVCALIENAFATQQLDDIEYTPSAAEQDGTQDTTGETLLQQLYDTVLVEPVDAAYDKETGGVTESVTGVSFDLEDAVSLWNAAAVGETIIIPLILTEPEITSEELESKLFADLLSEKSTTLSGSSSARITNITLAAEAMNETVLEPGEEFSYNDCLGERTAAKGYQEAGAYEGGRHVTSIGGGICQGSSTLYYCALYANLEITLRDNHYFVVSYLPWGLDATVSWGGPNFKFVNNRNYPIKISAWVSDGNLTVQLWGTDEDGSYVEMTSSTWEDDEYYYAQTYRNVYDADGNLISSDAEAYSRYHKYEAADEEEEEATPEPTATPAPTDTQVPTEEAPAAVTEPETPAVEVPVEETPAENETPVEDVTPVEGETEQPTADADGGGELEAVG